MFQINGEIIQLIKESFLNLLPVEKPTRTQISGYSGLYCEQNKSGYTFQLKYKSPITDKQRFMKLIRFKYRDNINKKMLDNVIKELVINQGIVAQGKDSLEKKRAIQEANKPKKPEKVTTVNELFDIFTESRFFKQLSENTTTNYLLVYKIVYMMLSEARAAIPEIGSIICVDTNST